MTTNERGKNREIKFRAWNPKSKTMWENVGYHPHQAEKHDDGSMTIAPFLECPIMQYTGLKDKNGKEIYEGDIVQTPLESVGVVTWHDCGLQLIFSNPGLGVKILSSQEIIGNIHEHPHLLETIS